jgi:hypothetical protein
MYVGGALTVEGVSQVIGSIPRLRSKVRRTPSSPFVLWRCEKYWSDGEKKKDVRRGGKESEDANGDFARRSAPFSIYVFSSFFIQIYECHGQSFF